MSAALIDRDRGWKKLLKEMQKASREPHAKVGVLQGKGAEEDHDGFTMVGLAAVHEFGSPTRNIPARAPIQRTLKVRERDLGKLTERLAGKVYDRKTTVKHAVGLLGAWGTAAIKGFVAEGKATPQVKPETLRKKTIRGKKGTTPLIDTGRLVNAITYEVIE